MDRLQQDKEVEEQRWKEETEEKIRLAKNALIFLSVLVMATVPMAWCSTGQPALLVWRLSLLLCSSSFISSRLLDVTVSAVTMFLAIFSGFMAALFVDTVLDRDIGVFMAHLNSHLAAGMLGYALAMHCQHNGLETLQETQPKKLSEKLSPRNSPRSRQTMPSTHRSLLGVISIWSRLWSPLAWLGPSDYPTEYLVLQAFAPMAFALLLCSMFLGVLLLRGVFIVEALLTLLGGHLILVEILLLSSYMVLGDVGAMIIK
ncbi:uncharacterized protein [Miscanthus floridulus]|uniref:uncharacterized protein n=1 Tax=Miscanthus floridulus TaxID=154761 RepID=UPI00345B4041